MIDATADTHDPGRDDCEEIDEPTAEEIARQYVAEHGRVEESTST